MSTTGVSGLASELDEGLLERLLVSLRKARVALELGGDQGGFAAIAFLDDFEQMEALLVGEAVSSEVIEDEQLRAGEFVDEAWEAAIETSERQILEQARHAHIEHGMIEPCRLPSERRRPATTCRFRSGR